MRKITSLLAASLFFAAIVTTSVYAATLRCTVEKVEENIVTLDCGDKAISLEAGTEVKVKTAKAKTAAIEGC